MVAFREPDAAAAFRWPVPSPGPVPTVGDTLYDLVAEHRCPGACANSGCLTRTRLRGGSPRSPKSTAG
ncbi:MAG: hypothetical protein ACRDRJ_28745 [Streptosporangiaceae bacterium]